MKKSQKPQNGAGDEGDALEGPPFIVHHWNVRWRTSHNCGYTNLQNPSSFLSFRQTNQPNWTKEWKNKMNERTKDSIEIIHITKHNQILLRVANIVYTFVLLSVSNKETMTHDMVSYEVRYSFM